MYLNGVRVTTQQARVIGDLRAGATLRMNEAGAYELLLGDILLNVRASVVEALVDKGFVVEREAGRFALCPQPAATAAHHASA